MIATTVKERPILFRGEMVRAILDGRKTQTRRVVKPQPVFGMFQCDVPDDDWWFTHGPLFGREPEATDGEKEVHCPYGKPGDRLWVRETFCPRADVDPDVNPEKAIRYAIYRATHGERGNEWHSYGKWKPSIFMPRWACRIVLEITDVRVERLNDISEEDAIAEGIERNAEGQWKHYLSPKLGTIAGPSPELSFQTLWESVRKPGAWAENPWVWVVGFKRVETV